MKDTYLEDLQAQVDGYARRGQYMTPECTYLASRLKFIRTGDQRAFDDMVRYVTLDVPA